LQRENKPMFAIQLADKLSDQVFDSPQKNFKEAPEIPKQSLTDLLGSISASRKTAVYRSEVDLHIEELVESTRGLTNFDMLSIQLDAFEAALDSAIAHG